VNQQIAADEDNLRPALGTPPSVGAVRDGLPTGTVTFLLTEVAGSSALWDTNPNGMRVAMAQHDRLIEELVALNGGTLVRPRGEGDSRFAVFSVPSAAVGAACAIQSALLKDTFGLPKPLQLHIALHSGEIDVRDGGYYGSAVNRCARLRTLAHGGQILLSGVTYDLVSDAVEGWPAGAELRPLGEHRLPGLQRAERIFQLRASDALVEFPPLAVARPANNLPSAVTGFVGRQRELATLRTTLERVHVRLLTLTGPGGVGKTRLALQLAANVLDTFADGVRFVDLSSVTEASDVASAIADGLGVREAGRQTELERVKEVIRDQQVLLLLDNFEHVLAAASDVADLLAVASPSKILVTSRAPLHIYGEHEFGVPPLDLPDRVPAASAETVTQFAAVTLFVQRAEAALPGFQVTNLNAAALAEICTRLDGLPLAIELAAARTKLLPPQALLGRLSNRLQLLTGGARDRPARQKTLRATIDWSYGLLDESEKALLRRLAVFAGGWTISAAEAVCSRPDEVVVDGLASLLDKSLLRREDTFAGEPRFRMLETIHEYALGQLELSGEAEIIRGRHAAYFQSVLEAADLEQRGQPIVWLDRLQEEHENLRAVLRWTVETRNAELALRLGAVLRRYIEIRGHLHEGQRWLESALAIDGPAPDAVRARALQVAGRLAYLRGDYALAAARHQQSLLAHRTRGDDAGAALALHSLGDVHTYQEDYEPAAALFQESLTTYQAIGNTVGTAAVLNSLGVLARNRGDMASAREYFDESLAIYRTVDDRRNMALLLNNLAKVPRDQGDWSAAVDLCRESMRLFGEMSDAWGVALVLANLGVTARRSGDALRAARLFGAAEAELVASTGSTFLSVSPAERAAYDAALLAAQTELGEAEFMRIWQGGRELVFADAVAEGLAFELARPPVLRQSRQSTDPLSRRERDVVLLIVEGHTNREIGEALVITEWTVDTHVRHILTKLGLRSRAQIAAWAMERRLLEARS
jgi:predicted ATPase/class 3 adenylate cyclase/DNA-binding CsgD family transcriptional regulator